jgi:hypothetical protein
VSLALAKGALDSDETSRELLQRGVSGYCAA